MDRRLARRGGIKRISATVYDDIRVALKDQLTKVSLLYLLTVTWFTIFFPQVVTNAETRS